MVSDHPLTGYRLQDSRLILFGEFERPQRLIDYWTNWSSLMQTKVR